MAATIDACARFGYNASMSVPCSSANGSQTTEGSLDVGYLLQRFASCLVHNVSNPLAAIVGCSQLLDRLLQNGEAVDVARCRSYAEIIDSEAQRCSRMLDRLAFLARPPAPRYADVDAHDVLHSALAAFACPEGIETVMECRAARSAVCADADLLVQALLALLENAGEAMPDGGKIAIGSDNPPGGENCVRLVVSDTGPGIAPEDLPHVAEPFFSTRQGHNGIGLTICRQLVESHGGRLTLRNTAPGSAEAIIELPLR